MLQPSALEEGDMGFCRSDKSVTLIPGGYEPSHKVFAEAISKLKHRSFREISYRTWRVIYRNYEKLRHPFDRHLWTDEKFLHLVIHRQHLKIPEDGGRRAVNSDHHRKYILDHMRSRQYPRFFIHPSEREMIVRFIKKRFPEWIPESIDLAESACRQEFSFLGIQVRYDGRVRWNADPVSGKEWPNGFYADVPIFSGDVGYGDVKHVWELNRHQYFAHLGKAYWLTGDSKYALKFFELVADWIKENPYNTGVNWSSTLELAYRVFAWLWAYFFCLDVIDPDTNMEILKSLYQHGRYIERHLSFYTSPYNHLIGEATALFMLGMLFPEFKHAKRWKEKGWKVLEDQIENQFHRDGGTVEQATFYHHATLGFYLIAAQLKKRNGEEVPEKIWSYIERATEFSMYMMKSDGTLPKIGDSDDAHPLILGHAPLWDFRNFLSIGAVLFKRRDMKMLSGKFWEDAFWLLGIEGYKAYESLKACEPGETSKAFPESGYYIMRSGWDKDAHYLCFDCGEHAGGVFRDATPSAAHGHADFLSFILSAFGKPVLADSGFYIYNGDREWCDYFHRTQAHNTIVIDGEDQSNHLGGMKWNYVAQAKCGGWLSTPEFDYVVGSHDGYVRRSGVIHRRTIYFFKNPVRWVIIDRLEGEGEHLVESYFHFAPDVDVELDLNTGMVSMMLSSAGEFKKLTLKPIPNVWNSIELRKAEDSSPFGWIGQSYGMKAPASVVCYKSELLIPVTFGWVIMSAASCPSSADEFGTAVINKGAL